MPKQLSEEEVFNNDEDPIEAIRAIRREEGVAEEDLPVSESDTFSEEVAEAPEGQDELDNLGTKDEEVPTVDEPNAEAQESTVEDAPQDNGDIPVEEGEADPATAEQDKTTAPEIHKFTADGKEFEFTQQEMLDQFGTVFAKAVGFTKKTQKLAPFSRQISALEKEGIDENQLNLLIDASKGNKQAIQALIENNNIDAYDLVPVDGETAENYQPQVYGDSDVQLNINNVTEQISGDEEYKITVDVIDRQWDQDSRDALTKNPNMIQGLHNDIKSGLYDKVAPLALKMKVYDGNTKSDIEYYMLAGQQVSGQQTQNSANAEQTVADLNKNAQAVEDESNLASSEAAQKRSASPTRTRSDRSGVTDYLADDNDEEYEAWYENLMASN